MTEQEKHGTGEGRMTELEKARERVRAAAAEPGKVIASIYPEKVGHYHCHVRVADLTTLDTALTEALAANARAFLAGYLFTQTGYGQHDAVGAYRAFLNGMIPGDDDEFDALLKTLSKSPATPAEGDETI